MNNYQLIERDVNGNNLGVSDFSTMAELEEWKTKLLKDNPDSVFQALDLTEKVAATKAKDEKRKLVRERLRSFDKTKIITLEAQAEVIADLVELMKE